MIMDSSTHRNYLPLLPVGPCFLEFRIYPKPTKAALPSVSHGYHCGSASQSWPRSIQERSHPLIPPRPHLPRVKRHCAWVAHTLGRTQLYNNRNKHLFASSLPEAYTGWSERRRERARLDAFAPKQRPEKVTSAPLQLILQMIVHNSLQNLSPRFT